MKSLAKKFFKFSLLIIFLCISTKNFSAKTKDIDLNSIVDLKERFQYKGAIDLLEKYNIEALDKQTKKFLAKLYFLDGKLTEAYRIFASLDEKDWETYLYLGLISEEKKKLKSAVNFYQSSYDLRPTTISAFRLAKIYYKKANYNKAKDYLLKVLELDPSFKLANYYLADCYIKLGYLEEAYSAASKAYQFYPKNPQTILKLTKVKENLGKDFFERQRQKIQVARKTIKLPYYRKIENVPLIKVGIAIGISNFVFRCAGEFYITDGKRKFVGKPNQFYTAVLKENKLFIRDQQTGEIYAKLDLPATIKSNFAFYILDITYGKGNYWQKTVDRIYRGDLEVIKKDNFLNLINIVSIEEYLYGVLPAEIPHNSPFETLKAQAIIARTIAFKSLGRHTKDGFDVCADVHCQVYQGLSAETTITNNAVDLTKGEILVDKNGKPIEALYHSNCGGCLRTDAFLNTLTCAQNKFDNPLGKINGKFPYEVSKYFEERWFIDGHQAFCYEPTSRFRWQRVYDKEDFYFVFGFDIEKLKAIVPVKKGECFHYDAVKIITDDKEFVIEGDLKIREYFDGLRSNAFKVEVQFFAQKPRMLFIWGAGFGHGQGLCQFGAIFLGKSKDYKNILKHYYPFASIKRLY